MIKVIRSGFFTTIQDSGRVGYREFGVPVSGPMDVYSSGLANALLGNDQRDAVMEITMTGPKLLFQSDTSICITGAAMNPIINGVPIIYNHMIAVSKNDVLSFGKLESGCRVYLAVSGGFQTEKVMGSRSMYPNITSKNLVENDDIIEIPIQSRTFTKTYASIKSTNDIFSSNEIEVFFGPEFNMLSKDLQSALQSNVFTISNNNNRMGYQLKENMENNLKSILTGPVLPGTVQLTPSGKLIVLMRDGQTTGGYPRVLQLKEASINVLSQKRVGDSIKFRF